MVIIVFITEIYRSFSGFGIIMIFGLFHPQGGFLNLYACLINFKLQDGPL